MANRGYYFSPYSTHHFQKYSVQELIRKGYQKNPIVFACITAISRVYSEARYVVRNYNSQEIMWEHPIQKVLESPHEDFPPAKLMQFMASYSCIGGNCYLHAQREASTGAVIGLFPYSDLHITPISDDKKLISHYELNIQGQPPKKIDKNDIIHLGWNAIDPLNPSMFVAPMASIVSAMDTYTEVENYVASLIKNDLVPRSVFTFPEEPTPNAVGAIKEYLEKAKTKAKGQSLILTEGAKYERISLGLDEMQMEQQIKALEIRICAAFGISPILAVTLAGLNASTYSNYGQSARDFTLKTMLPLWTLHLDIINSFFRRIDPTIYVDLDRSAISGLNPLQEQAEQLHQWDWKNSAITLNEYRKKKGYDQVEDGDKFFHEFAVPPEAPAPEVPQTMQTGRGNEATAQEGFQGTTDLRASTDPVELATEARYGDSGK